jgi:SAM-dependent methyltransferase
MPNSGPDWDVFWRWEHFIQGDAPPVLRSRFRWYKAFLHLYGHRSDLLVLDSSCGSGASLSMLRRAGFDADGCDASDMALEWTRARLKKEGIHAFTFKTRWADLANTAPRKYDAVINDALCWILSEDDFVAALRGIRSVLKPSALLVFAGATDRDPNEGAGRLMATKQWESEKEHRFSLVNFRNIGAVSVSHIKVSEFVDGGIDVHHLYIVREDGTERLERAWLRNPWRYDWPILNRIFERAGFARIDCIDALADDAPLVVNVARKDA